MFYPFFSSSLPLHSRSPPSSCLYTAMVRDLKAAEKQLRDLTLTVELVQKDRAQFAHIDDFELENRTGYIAKTRDEVRTLTAYFKGDNVKQKMVADERQAVAEQARSLGATNSDEAENTHFIAVSVAIATSVSAPIVRWSACEKGTSLLGSKGVVCIRSRSAIESRKLWFRAPLEPSLLSSSLRARCTCSRIRSRCAMSSA